MPSKYRASVVCTTNKALSRAGFELFSVESVIDLPAFRNRVTVLLLLPIISANPGILEYMGRYPVTQMLTAEMVNAFHAWVQHEDLEVHDKTIHTKYPRVDVQGYQLRSFNHQGRLCWAYVRPRDLSVR